jgi:small-conductance mechanosensitive channel
MIHKGISIQRKHLAGMFFFIILILNFSGLPAQDTTYNVEETDTVIHLERINQAYHEISSEMAEGFSLQDIQSEFEEISPGLERFLEIGGKQIAIRDINRIHDLIIILQKREKILVTWQQKISSISAQLSGFRIETQQSIRELEAISASGTAFERVYNEQINSQLLQMQALDHDIRLKRELTQRLQAEISLLNIKVKERLYELKQYRAQFWTRLIQSDSKSSYISQPFFGVDFGVILWRLGQYFNDHWVSNFLFIGLFIGVNQILIRIRRRDSEKQFVMLYRRHIPIALVLSLLLFPVIYPPTTSFIYNILLIVTYIPFLLILRLPPFKPQFPWYLLFFAGFFLLKVIALLAQYLSSTMMDILYLCSAAIFMIFLLNKRQYKAFDAKWNIASIILWGLKLLIVLGVLALVFNRTVLFRFLIEGTGNCIALGMVLLYVAHWLDQFVDYIKQHYGSSAASPDEVDSPWNRTKIYARLVTLILFGVGCAYYLHILDILKEWVISFLNDAWVIGDNSFTLGGILLFVSILWLSAKISSWIKIYFDGKDYYRSVKKTSTLATMLRFGVIMVGFLLALFFSGIPLDKITIIVGALSVGLGFGLQNIVNNLVSGIILIFERPVQVGDFVDVKNYSGIIKEIGIRASILRTFDGAEVIIPNGHLISEEVINWTLSNQHRRVEVLVGVAYGSDVDQVMQILNGIVSSFRGILKHPKPVVLFKEMGESSLNFSMRFWVSDIDEFLVIKSEITTAIYKAFSEAGIQIPFPQQDIYIKSMPANEMPDTLTSVRMKKEA